jgi:transposase-like protein
LTAVDRARKFIEDRLGEIEKEAASLRAALTSLERTTGRPPARRSRTSPPSKTSRRRATRGQRQEEFLAALNANPGAPMSHIAREIGVRPQQLYPIAHRLTDAGRIFKRRGGGYALSASGALGEPESAEAAVSE